MWRRVYCSHLCPMRYVLCPLSRFREGQLPSVIASKAYKRGKKEHQDKIEGVNRRRRDGGTKLSPENQDDFKAKERKGEPDFSLNEAIGLTHVIDPPGEVTCAHRKRCSDCAEDEEAETC